MPGDEVGGRAAAVQQQRQQQQRHAVEHGSRARVPRLRWWPLTSFGGQLGATGFVLYLEPAGVATEAPLGGGDRLHRLGPP